MVCGGACGVLPFDFKTTRHIVCEPEAIRCRPTLVKELGITQALLVTDGVIIRTGLHRRATDTLRSASGLGRGAIL